MWGNGVLARAAGPWDCHPQLAWYWARQNYAATLRAQRDVRDIEKYEQDKARCEALGIVNRVVPDEDLADEALAWARRLAAGPSVAFRYMKANLDRALRADLPTCLAGEALGTVRSAMTEDHREAVSAFVAKRKPVFRGR